jgi:hypothetical protein
MRSKPVAFLLADLGVTKTHSRPYTSTDNPYSEAADPALHRSHGKRVLDAVAGEARHLAAVRADGKVDD